jgi:hypothetical protein
VAPWGERTIGSVTFEEMEQVVRGFELAGLGVLVRTFLSFCLGIELEGVVP